MLWTSSTEWVLRMPFAGQNHFFDAKTTFPSLFCSISDGKSCISVENLILTSEQNAEHPLAGRNTQYWTNNFVYFFELLHKGQ